MRPTKHGMYARPDGGIVPLLSLCLVAALALAVQAGSADLRAARLYDRGLTFGQFLAHASAQREVWLKNAARTDVPADAIERLKRVRSGLRILIVAEDWCADSVHTVPYLATLAAAAGVALRIVDRTGGAEIMALHRTRDGRPVTPVVVLLRANRDVGAWVERPLPLQEMFFGMAGDPDRARQFADRARWYDDDRGRTTVAEFVALAEQTVGK
jgi:hypothetical protein